MTIQIREEAAQDRATVLDLVETTFAHVAESDHQEQHLVERLHRSDAFVPQLSLVAETEEGRLVGYILLTKVTIASEHRTALSLGVAPLVVHPEFQRQGIGGRLIEKAHEVAVDLGYGSAVLLGHKDYYPRFGYRRAADFGIWFPFEAPDECCMVVELMPHALKEVKGEIRYPAAFFE